MDSDGGPLRRSAPDSSGDPQLVSSKRILSNFARFDTEVRLAEAAYAHGELEMAAFYAATAATIATHKHCGIFASPRVRSRFERDRTSDRLGRNRGKRQGKAFVQKGTSCRQ